MKFYLVTTAHLETGVWFRDEDDYRYAMNAVALISFILNVKVYAFILMSNHVHFVLACSRTEAEKYINEFKRNYSQYVHNKYGIREMLRRNKVDIQELSLEGESLERGIAYVQMNSVAANICLSANMYPWGTGACFFDSRPIKGTPIESLSKRGRCQLFRTKRIVSAPFVLGDDGYVLPESYVKVNEVEEIFRSAKRMNFFLTTSSKSKKRLEAGETNLPAFRDQLVIQALSDICMTIFGKKEFKDLSSQELAEALRQVKYRFSCNEHQLSRVTGLSYENVTKILDSID